MTDAEELWKERRAHLQTKLQLYQAQSVVLQASFEKAQSELAAMGEKWTAPDETPPAA